MLDPVKTIIVGKPSSGKTFIYADFPKPHIVVDADGKIRNIKFLMRDKVSLRELKSYDEFDYKDMESIQYVSAKAGSFDSMYGNLRDILRDPPMNKDTGEPGTFTMDSLTSIADQAIGYGLQQRSGSAGKSMGIVPIPDLPEWLGESMFLSSLFTDVQLLPCNVVLTAHMVITEREVMASAADRRKGLSGGNKVTKQLMTGGTKIGNKIPVYFSEVWNAQAIANLSAGDPPSRQLFTVITEECDFVRTKLPLPPIIDYTYDYDNPPESVWSIVNKARIEAERMMNG
jgi:hypothetical protein